MNARTSKDRSTNKGKSAVSCFASLIPRFLPNRLLLFAMDVMSAFSFAKKSVIEGNRIHNEAGLRRFMSERSRFDRGFLECQNALCDLKYGRERFSRSGCEIIAAYNIYRAFGREEEIGLTGLISIFERKGMLRGGTYGTSPLAVGRHLRQNGFSTSLCTNEKRFGRISEKFKVMILVFYNDTRDIREMIHTVACTRGEDGWMMHNLLGDGYAGGPYAGTEDFFRRYNNGKAKGIALIGIDDRSHSVDRD